MSVAKSVSVGDQLGPWTVHITRDDVRQYADASGDHNPIHLDETAALALGLPGLVAHGMLTSAKAIGLIAEWAGGAAHIISTDIRFAAPVVVPAVGAADIEVAASIRSVDPASNQAQVALDARCEGAKIFGKAMVVVTLSTDFRADQEVT